MDKELIIAASFTQEYEAVTFAGRLESEGIACFVDDNNITVVDPFLSNAVGGVKVRIRKSDADKARKIIDEIHKEKNPEHLNNPIAIVNGQKYRPALGYCPNCDSQKVYSRAFGLWKFLVGIFFALWASPAPFKNHMYCVACEHRWKKYG